MSKLRIVTEFLTGSVSKGAQNIRSTFRNLRKDVNGQLGRMLAVGSITAGIKGMLDEAERVSDIAAKFGVLPSEIAKIENVAKVSGASVAGLNGVLNASYRRAQEAANGNKTYADSFSRLGISVKELKGMNATQLFMAMADGVKSASDRGQAFADVFNVAGEQGREFFTTLSYGSEEIDRMGSKMGVMSDFTANSLAKVNTDFRATFNVLKTFGANVLSFILRVGQSFFSVTAAIALSIGGLFKANVSIFKVLIATAAETGKALGRLGSVFKRLIKLDFSGAAKEWKEAGRDLGNAFVDGAEQAMDARDKLVQDIKFNFSSGKDEIKDLWKAPEAPEIKAPEFDAPDFQSDKELDGINKARERVAAKEREMALEAMSAEERIIALEKEKLELAKLVNDETEEGLNKKLELLNLEQRIAKEKESLKTDKGNKPEEVKGPKITSDFLAKIGGGGSSFIGPEKAAQSTREKMLEEQKRTNTLLANIKPAGEPKMKS